MLPVLKQHEGAGVVLHDLALLGEDGDALFWVAPVVEQNADQQSVRAAVRG